MLIEEKALRHWIDHFYGYGSWRARLWFIAYEEGGGDVPADVAQRVNYFLQLASKERDPTLCDIHELYQHVDFTLDGPKPGLYKTRYDYRFGPQSVQHGIWKNLISFAHAYRNEALPDLLEYQKTYWMRNASAQEALMVLYPLPSPHNHAWYYSWLDMPSMSFLRSRAAYEEYLFERRIQHYLGNISLYKPEVVLMYAMNNVTALKAAIKNHFPGAKFSVTRQVKLQVPQHHHTDIGGTKLIITTQMPALRHNRAETGFDWASFAELVKSY